MEVGGAEKPALGEKEPRRPTPSKRIARTLVQNAAWICMGLYSEVSGPTLPHLMANTGSNFEEISRVLVARSVGFLVGALAGGVLCDRFNRLIDLWLALSLFVAAGATAYAPWCQDLGVMGLMFCLDGLGKGVLAAGGNAFLIQIWGEDAAVPTHSIHFSYGIGAIIIPQIAAPFLGEPSAHHTPNKYPGNISTNQVDNNLTGYNIVQDVTPGLHSMNQTYVSRDITEELLSDDFWIPYIIAAALTTLTGLVYLGFLFWAKKDFVRNKSIKDIFKFDSFVTGHKVLGTVILSLLMFSFILCVGAERIFGKFIVAFATTTNVKFGYAQAATLESVFWISFTAGRGLSTITARLISPTKLIISQLTLGIISSAILAAYGDHIPMVLWVFSAMFGLVLAPMTPALLSWANVHLNLTAMITSLAFIASAIGAFVFSWLGGYLFQYYGPTSMMYMLLAYALGGSVVFAVMVVIARIKVRLESASREPQVELNEKERVEKETFLAEQPT